MRLGGAIAVGILLASVAPQACADPLVAHGVLDLRLTTLGNEPNWMDGGFGKLRWGGADSELQLGGATLVLEAPFAPAWFARGTVQAQADDGAALELLDAWVRWRPVSTGRWRHALKAGLMFPPVSLEHEGVGWTSPYTLTPSALNAWIGEEVRSTGVEWRVERRGEAGNLEFALTAFGGNDTTGELLATRGWALSDRVYGVGGTIRTPDPSARGAPPPRRFDPFVEIDHRVGVSGEATWRGAGGQRFTVLHYDNLADPSVETHHGAHEVYAWRTRFTSVAWERRGARSTWLAQALHGDTEIRPSPFFRTRTDFWAAYALWARTEGAWRPAARVEWFGARQWPDFLQPPGTEHGRALAFALTWQPRAHWQLTGELVALHSARGDRVLLGRDERQSEAQLQLAWRWYF
jgi:hypothetical protein